MSHLAKEYKALNQGKDLLQFSYSIHINATFLILCFLKYRPYCAKYNFLSFRYNVTVYIFEAYGTNFFVYSVNGVMNTCVLNSPSRETVIKVSIVLILINHIRVILKKALNIRPIKYTKNTKPPHLLQKMIPRSRTRKVD